MKKQYDFLSDELSTMNELINTLEKLFAPNEGCLIPEQRGNITYYYFRKKGTRKKTYLGNSNSPKVIQFKLNEMVQLLLCTLKRDQISIEKCLSSLSNYSYQSLLNFLLQKYSWTNSDLCFDEKLNELIEWANMNYEKNSKEFPDSINIASDGTRVRSKGEEIWYNQLLSSGIPFRYDCLIDFTDSNGFTVKKAPDFLIQCYDGSFIIIEHLGLLAKDYYYRDFIEKIQIYHTSGFTIGSNFFITSDETNGGTDSQAIERTIELIKLKFLEGAPAEVRALF